MIPGVIDWVAIPAGPFRDGRRPARAFPPDEDETPRRSSRLAAFRIARSCRVDGRRRPAGDVRLARRGRGVLRGARRAAADRGGVGGGGARRRRPALAVGRRAARPTRASSRGHRRAGRRSARIPAGASPCGALDMAGNVFEWTGGGAVRGGSYLSGPDELRCSARLPMHPAARDTYVGFRVVAVEPRARLRLGRRAGGEYAIGRDAGERAATSSTSHAFELARTPVTNAQYAAFVAETAPTRRRTGPRRPTIRSRSSTGTRRRRSAPGRAAGCRPRPSGRRPRAAPTAARYPWGDEEDASRAAVGAGLKRGTTVAGRRAPGRARALTVCRTWPATSGSGRRARTTRDPAAASACCAAARSRAPASRGRAARCAAAAGRAAAGAHRLPGREGADERLGATACATARSRSCEVESPTGDTADVARLYARLVRGARHGGRVPGRRLPGDADGRRAAATAASPGPTRRALRAPRHRADPARPAAGRGRPRLRPRLGRHEGRRCVARSRRRGCSASPGRSRASSCWC